MINIKNISPTTTITIGDVASKGNQYTGKVFKYVDQSDYALYLGDGAFIIISPPNNFECVLDMYYNDEDSRHYSDVALVELDNSSFEINLNIEG